MRLSRVSFVLLSFILGCEPSTPPVPVTTLPPIEADPVEPPHPDLPGPPSTAKRPPLVLQPTNDLVTDPETRRLIDALASEARMESSHIGAAGAPSAIWAKWDAIAKRATPAEIVALTRHEKPVVRGYAAQYVIHSLPAEAGALLPLLGDQATVHTQEGCSGADTTLAGIIIEGLSHAGERSRAGEDVLLAAAADPTLGSWSAQALAWVARARPDDVEAHMRYILVRAPEARRLEVLRAVGTLTPKGLCPELATLARSPNPAMRQAVAHALGACQDARGLGVIEALLGDPARSESIGMLAGLHDPQDLAEMRRSLRSWNSRELDAAFGAVVAAHDALAIPVLEEMAGEKNVLAKRRAEDALATLQR